MPIFPKNLAEYLKSHSILNLAVLSHAGHPHSLCVFYSYAIENKLLIMTSPESLHGQYIAQNPRISATIHGPETSWFSLNGLQLHGQCSLVEDKDHDLAWQTYSQTFNFLKLAPKPLAKSLSQSRLWEIQIIWARLTDNSKHFKSKEEWTLS
jgi:uncharacterized protein YhbP (UPF0306 family)